MNVCIQNPIFLDRLLAGLDTTLKEISEEIRPRFEATFSLPEDWLAANLVQPLADIENTLRDWNGKVAHFSSQIGNVSVSGESLGQGLAKCRAEAEGLQAVLQEIRLALSADSSLSNGTARLLKGLDDTCDQLTTFETALREHTTSLKGTIAEDLRITQERRARLEEEVSRATDALNLVHGQLIESVQYIHDQLKE